MTEIEKMKKYIERTKLNKSPSYQMSVCEILSLSHATAETPTDAVCLAFEYGRAKGYRAAKAEGRATA